MNIGVGSATRTDVPAIAACMAAAFVDDPVMTLIVPANATDRNARLQRAYGMLTRFHYLPLHCTDVARLGGDVRGAALWSPPGIRHAPMHDQLRSLPGMARALGPKGMRASARMGRLALAHRPPEPHWHLAMIGVDARGQGHGVGTALLEHRLGQIDAVGATAYLEASSPRNVPYYERFGFTTTAQIELPTGVTLYGMLRRPQLPRH